MKCILYIPPYPSTHLYSIRMNTAISFKKDRSFRVESRNDRFGLYEQYPLPDTRIPLSM